MNADFIKHMNASYAPNTRESYTRYINSLLNFTNKKDIEITSGDINEWLAWMADNGRSGATRKQALDSVKAYYKYLVEGGCVEFNPCRLVKAPSVKNKPKHYMDSEMIQNMAVHAKSYRDKAIILLYASSCMRVSELTGITIEEYMDMKARGDNRIEIKSKREKRRFVDFSLEAQEYIDKYIPIRNAGKVKCNKLFLTNQGNQLARSNLNTALKNIAKEAGIPFYEDMSNHQLRSAGATIYYEEDGMTIPELQELLGHEKPATTLLYTKASHERVARKVRDKRFM